MTVINPNFIFYRMVGIDLSDAVVDSYPSLTLNLVAGVQLVMSSRDYLLKGSPLAKVFSLS